MYRSKLCIFAIQKEVLYQSIVLYFGIVIRKLKEMEVEKKVTHTIQCSSEFARAIRDTIDFFNGKWKLPILASLMGESRRFNEMERMIPKITPRMLSKELRDLEINKMIKRIVYDTIPATVVYEITPYGKSMDTVLFAMYEWGMEHRKRIIED